MAGEILEVARDSAICGMVKINHRNQGYSYHYYLDGQTDLFVASSGIMQTLATMLSYIIPIGSEVFDSFCYRPDKKKESVSGITKSRPTRCTDILTPGNGSAGAGFVINDKKTCVQVDIYTKGWKGREYFRTPPDVYVSDNLWVGPDWPVITPASANATFDPNSSNVTTTQVAGTWIQRLQDYYTYVMKTMVKEWRYKKLTDGTIDPDVIEVSDMKYMNFRRVTSHKMGRAFVP